MQSFSALSPDATAQRSPGVTLRGPDGVALSLKDRRLVATDSTFNYTNHIFWRLPLISAWGFAEVLVVNGLLHGSKDRRMMFIS